MCAEPKFWMDARRDVDLICFWSWANSTFAWVRLTTDSLVELDGERRFWSSFIRVIIWVSVFWSAWSVDRLDFDVTLFDVMIVVIVCFNE